VAHRGLRPGTLWDGLRQRTEEALRTGALQPIATDQEMVREGETLFLVRILTHLARKTRARKTQEGNPFLPYEEDLFVADVSDTHVCLLNKFNVIDHHLLIVTRAFVDQDALLDEQDFEALCVCMAEFPALGFYNAGTVAGASQPHKHLQMVPLPLAPAGPPVPIHPLLTPTPDLPFAHAFRTLDSARMRTPREAASYTLGLYRELLREVGLDVDRGPYNLLVTREWILLVPREEECFDGVSVNALGFAGALLVRDRTQLQRLKDLGPMSVLAHVARRG